MPTDIQPRGERIVDLQTTTVQPDRVPVHRLVSILANYGREDAGDVRTAVDELVADGRLEREGEEVWIPDGREVEHHAR
jgi:hypothetical protein